TTSIFSQLVSEAVFREEDSLLNKYWPDLHSDFAITLAQLATHTSGLPSYHFLRELYTYLTPSIQRDPYCQYSIEELKSFLNCSKLKRQGKFQYSNVGMGLLGLLMSWRMNCSFHQLVKTYIAEPLSMHSTGVYVAKKDEHRLIEGYSVKG